MNCRVLGLNVAIVLGALATAPIGAAQDYPTKPIRIVVGFGPGGPTDTIARTLAEHFQKTWGQPALTENKPGAGSNIGADAVAKAAPDGHTLFVGGVGPLAINRALYSALAFDPEKDFALISTIARTPLAFTVNNDVPAKSVREFVAYAKANTGKLNHSSPGVGTSPHLAAELFRSTIGFESQHAPYRSGPLMLEALVKGEVHWTFDAPLTAMPQHKNAKARVLALTSAARWASYPDIPTMVEQGFPDVVVLAWFALAAPAGTPVAILRKLNVETAHALATDGAKQRLAAIGFEPAPLSEAETVKYTAAERERWSALIRAQGIRVE